VHFTRIFFRTNGNFFLQQDISGINIVFEFKGGDTRLFFPVDDGPVNRRRTAIFW
jgi:hypothetical protein